MIRLVLFDIDGTLIRTGGAGVKAFESTFASEFKLAGATGKLRFAGRTDTSLARETFELHRISPSAGNFLRFFESYVFWLDYWLRELDGGICPGVSEFIAGFERVPCPPVLGLLTGNTRLGAEIKLRHFGLWRSFRLGAFGDDHEDRNCLASIAQSRARQIFGLEIPGREILVIGDTPLDIECAKSIKAKVLAVATGGYTCGQLQSFQPTEAVENLRQLTPSQLLETMCSPDQ